MAGREGREPRERERGGGERRGGVGGGREQRGGGSKAPSDPSPLAIHVVRL